MTVYLIRKETHNEHQFLQKALNLLHTKAWRDEEGVAYFYRSAF